MGGGFRAGRTRSSVSSGDGKHQAAWVPLCPCGFREAFLPLPRAASRELPSKDQSASMRCSDLLPVILLGEGLGWSEGTGHPGSERNLPAQVGAAERILCTPGLRGLSSRERIQTNHRRHHRLRCCRCGILPVDSLQLQTCS